MVRVSALILAVVLAVTALWWLSRDILPPSTIRFAAGTENGGYWRIAERYRDILARDNIDLKLIPTAGSVENARLMASGEADAALLQGGIAAGERIETLGAVFTEPFLIFARPTADVDVPRNPAQWSGLRIAAGEDGSGTRAAAQAFLNAAGLSDNANTLLPRGGAEAASALTSGDADVALFVAPLSAPYLAPLLADGDTTLLQLDHIVALSRRMPQSILVDVPSGAFALDPPLPARERQLLGLVARIVAQPELHPAIVDRLVEAAREVHEPGDVITPEGQFPTMDNTSLPQDPYARDLIADGASPLNAFLPYWVVAQISRFAILLLPIVFLLLPLLRTLPGLYKWSVRNRVFRHYARIREIDEAASETEDPQQLRELQSELAELDRQIANLHLPLTYRGYAYDARLHIDLLRKRIANRVA
ncbi:ABC transporter substrate-binding protein [Endozoicomonas sp. G2_2]|uniref:TAXI family TRAP transporter solute-binding subunit n=1 Tax=Endozoicomonas sp. G2_2 TaxID=2821092 RepID=UPI001ADAD6A9|nr:TAXI family TRAP transporter solute-binding subunit [Endozoicomonas sp. G2_2]MBO9470884.1 ABC transporter substrate-binding protein [Endozoicomonas sp. G2_2]